MKKFLETFSTTDIRHIISIMYLFMVLAYIYVLIFKPVPEPNKDLINVLGGTLISGSGLILGFYFGSSKDKSQ